MSRTLNHTTSFVLVFVALSLLLVGARASSVTAAEPGPVLTSAAVLASEPGMISVTGEAFTPGGEVYLALYDTWGTALHETRWITASPEIYGPNGSMDPARGYVSGGSLTQSFGGLCGESVMVRAFDQASGAWSNWLDLALFTTPSAIYGPNGSMDPARGYHPVC
jgi:hypothetical protein